MSGNLIIDDLGHLDGEVLIFGGCYSNLQAARALLAEVDARGIPPGNVICTGDIVGYGADPVAVVDMVSGSGWAVIAGNVERQIGAQKENCGCGFEEGSACDRLSQGWYRYAVGQVRSDQRHWMQALPDMITFIHQHRRYLVVHGAPSDIARFVWPVSDEAIFRSEFDLAEAVVGPVNAVLAGHCGIPFERVMEGRHWINAGAIGMPPHDGRSLTRFAVLGSRGVRIERLEYDAEAAAKSMVHAGLTQGYEQSLLIGIWPSEDVLPEEMRRVQRLASG